MADDLTIRRSPFVDPPTDSLAGRKSPSALAIPEPRTPTDLDRPSTAALTSFIDVDFIEAAFEETGWNIRDEVDLLVEIASDPDQKANVRMNAAKELRILALKALVLRGDLATINASQVTVSEDGRTTQTQAIQSIVKRAQNAESRFIESRVAATPPQQSEPTTNGTPNESNESNEPGEPDFSASARGRTHFPPESAYAGARGLGARSDSPSSPSSPSSPDPDPDPDPSGSDGEPQGAPAQPPDPGAEAAEKESCQPVEG